MRAPISVRASEMDKINKELRNNAATLLPFHKEVFPTREKQYTAVSTAQPAQATGKGRKVDRNNSAVMSTVRPSATKGAQERRRQKAASLERHTSGCW